MCKNGWTDRFAICVVDSSGPKDAQVQSYLPGGANLPDDTLPWSVQKWWTDRFAVWVLESGGPKEAQVQSYSPGGANVPSWEDTLPPPDEYDWTICRGGDAPYVKLLWTLVIFGHAHLDNRTDSRVLQAEYCIVGIPHNTAI